MQRWIWGVVLGGLLSGCANLEKQPADAPEQTAAKQQTQATQEKAQAQPQEESEAEAVLPHAELTPELLYQLTSGEIAGQQGDLNYATQQYLEAARASGDPRIAKRATRIAAYAQDTDRTIEAASLWDAQDPDNVEIKQILAAVWLKEGNVAKARPYLQDILRLSSSSREAYKRLEGILAQVPEDSTLDQILLELTRDQPEDVEVQFLFARLATRRGQYEKAEAYLDKVLAKQPERIEALMMKTELLKEREADEEALQTLKQAVSVMPDNAKLRLEYVRALYQQSQQEAAFTELKATLERFSDSPQVVLTGAMMAMEMEQLSLAQKWLTPIAKSADQHSQTAMFFLGQIASVQEDYDKAIYWFSKVTNGRYQLEAKLRLAIVLVQQERYEEALEQLEYLQLEDEQQLVKVVQVRAEIQREMKRYQAAYETYSMALEQYPNNDELLYGRSMIAERLGRIDLLEQDLRKILQQDPDDAQALNALGYSLADMTDRYKEALEYISRALELNPEDVATQDSMGWVLYKMGRPDEAINYLQKAYQNSQDGEIAAHLGEVLWVTGNRELANSIWDKALTEDPDHDVLLETVERLREQASDQVD